MCAHTISRIEERNPQFDCSLSTNIRREQIVLSEWRELRIQDGVVDCPCDQEQGTDTDRAGGLVHDPTPTVDDVDVGDASPIGEFWSLPRRILPPLYVRSDETNGVQSVRAHSGNVVDVLCDVTMLRGKMFMPRIPLRLATASKLQAAHHTRD